MSGDPALPLDGDVSDLLAAFARTFPGWRVTATNAGWWATRGSLVREDLDPADRGTIRAGTAAELWVRLEREAS